MPFKTLTDSASDLWQSASGYMSGLVTPTVRLGVTGLARSGKTVFITALVHNLVEGGRLPFFTPAAEGRILRAYLEPQPDDDVPRFAYEDHCNLLGSDPPEWPVSTNSVSQLRVTIEYETDNLLRRSLGANMLHVDIVDYPGEWLIDLPLLDMSYEDWAADALELAGHATRSKHAAAFIAFLKSLDERLADKPAKGARPGQAAGQETAQETGQPTAQETGPLQSPSLGELEQIAREGAELFTQYLRDARADDHALSIAGPGRFLMPGDLKGSPLLTFFPLDFAAAARPEGADTPQSDKTPLPPSPLRGGAGGGGSDAHPSPWGTRDPSAAASQSAQPDAKPTPAVAAPTRIAIADPVPASAPDNGASLPTAPSGTGKHEPQTVSPAADAAASATTDTSAHAAAANPAALASSEATENATHATAEVTADDAANNAAPGQPAFRSSSAKGRAALAALLARRFGSYKSHVVKPFFRNHFVRLDRQIVLVDTLAALNKGPAALTDLKEALEKILKCFRPGANSWLSAILFRRIDKLLFAATKADHLHHTSHDRLEAVLELLVRDAAERASLSGADVKVMAIAALRATREVEVKQGGDVLTCIQGVPLPGEHLGDQVFDGKTPVAIFPGDLPEDAAEAIRRGREAAEGDDEDLRFIRFRPPALNGGGVHGVSVPETNITGTPNAWPHIRLDRAFEFLIGDRLK